MRLARITALALFFCWCAPAQDIFNSVLRGTFTDLAALRAKAEAGDRDAQFTWANTLAGYSRNAEALYWYGQAAQRGKPEAVYLAGRLLLLGAGGNTPTNRVAAQPHIGVQLVYAGATNGVRDACYEMHRAYKDGLGVTRDLTVAYSWLQHYLDSSGIAVITLEASRRQELNSLAMSIDSAAVQEAKRLAADYKARRWPALVVVPPAVQPGAQAGAGAGPGKGTASITALKLSGIIMGKNPLAIINGKTLAEGEEVSIPLKPTPVRVKCIRIEDRMVTVALDGDPAQHRLGLN